MSNRIRVLSIVALVALSLAACTAVQASARQEALAGPVPVAQTDSPQSTRNIMVVGEGKVSLKPDIATINVGSEARADTASEAKSEVDAQMDSVLTALQEAGVAEEDIRTSHYSIHYDQQPMPLMREGPVPQAGYRVSSMVQVTVRDVEKAGDVLDAVVQAGANQVYGVTFTVSDESTWQTEARTKAMADARARAQELAGLADVELGQVLSVSEVIGGVSTAVMGIRVERGMGGGGIAPGELELRTQIQVAFAIH
jgi:uncharacterized protein YggE